MSRESIGKRGESVFVVRLTARHDGASLFRLCYLGDQWPVVDYLVEVRGRPGFVFMVQVRATGKGTTKAGKLRVTMGAKDIENLSEIPLPTYLVMIDDMTEEAYISAPTGGSTGRISHSLRDPAVRMKLLDEVCHFWSNSPEWDRNSSAFLEAGS